MFDTVIENGLLIDGTGNPWFRGDVGIHRGKITKIGGFDEKAERVLDVSGLVVCPGFIDIHTHSDLSLLINPRAESKIRQGVTTEVVGNCGVSAAPVKRGTLQLLKDEWGSEADEVQWNWSTLGDYLSCLEKKGISLNVATFVGHGTVRIAVIGVDNRQPTKEELEEMKTLVAQSMKEGAFGLSSGLVYLPGCFAKTSELIELSKAVAAYGGIYASHTRGERETIMDALKEAITIGEKAGLPVQVSHNCPKYGAHGKFKEMANIYEEARAREVEVTLDNDAHTDFNPSLSQTLPPWAQVGGIKKIVERLTDPETRRRIKKEIIEDRFPGPGYNGLLKHGRWDRIFLLDAKKNKDLMGQNLQQIADLRRQDPFDTFFDLIIEEKGEVSALFNYIEEEDIRTVLKNPLMMVCSDGAALTTSGVLGRIGGYSPCSYGEYPYILQRYVREERILTLQDAIRKMTSFPAQKLGLKDRGLLREGMWADIVVFDAQTIEDKATSRYPYDFPLPNYPHRYPEGIEYVIVNGQVVVERGKHKGVFPGKVLRHLSDKTSSQITKKSKHRKGED
jgi:N-acyl-D-amino-acid deacylase